MVVTAENYGFDAVWAIGGQAGLDLVVDVPRKLYVVQVPCCRL
jgi:hypothetical protein